MRKARALRGIWPAVVLALGVGCGCASRPASAQDVLVVSPAFDHNDRILELLAGARPAPKVTFVSLDTFRKPEYWRRSGGESRPVPLSQARLVVLETAHANGLADVKVAGGGTLLDRLRPWVREGGHLLVVGGIGSFESYWDGPLDGLLPVKAPRAGAREFKSVSRRALSGSGADGTLVEHVHPVGGTKGEVLVRAGGQPYVVRAELGSGRVQVVLGGLHEYYTPDAGPDPEEFFSSPAWARMLLGFAGEALGQTLTPGPPRDLGAATWPAVRPGARIRVDFWFPGAKGGVLSLRAPPGGAVFEAAADEGGWVELPEALRHGAYVARLQRGRKQAERPVRVDAPGDPSSFDIRLWYHSHGPSPFGLAPGEAWDRARELVGLGFTSVTYLNHWSRREQSQRDLRALREITAAGLEIAYMHPLYAHNHPKRWPFGPAPKRARDFSGKEVAWDLHDESFRRGADQLLDVVPEVRALPRMRALQVIEEFADGGRRSPSLAGVIRGAGLTGNELPGDPGYWRHEELRSKASGETFQRFRAMANRFLPGIPLSTYWPGSYWDASLVYALRVPELARAVDELMGPGYGYEYSGWDTGWSSVSWSATQIFAAQGHRRPEGGGLYVYALGDSVLKKGDVVGEATWRETAFTALGRGAMGLAYFHLRPAGGLRSLAALHDELLRIGPWLGAAPRKPARVALLASWTTRMAGSEAERRRQHRCLGQLHLASVKAFEEVDVLLEEQSADPPDELEALMLAATPALTDETVAALERFVLEGGHLLVEPGAASRTQDGRSRPAPFAAVRPTGRVHVFEPGPGCAPAPAALRAQLAGLGIEPESSTPKPLTEARLLGNDEVRAWLLLNHGPESAEVQARGRFDPRGSVWLDLRSGAPVQLAGGSEARVSRRVASRDAVVLMGVKRPAANLSVEVRAEPTALEIAASPLDGSGRAVADGYPLRLEAEDAAGRPRVPANSASRTVRRGSLRWVLPLPVEAGDESWQITVSDPITGLRETRTVPVPALRP